jgi:ADP-heptose:LPS heptosyltransferase
MTKTINDGIYFMEEEENTTHFIGFKNGKILDPYRYYQFPNTHGFCQLFAFFLYIDNKVNFRKVSFDGTMVKKDYKIYVNNSFECVKKLINILKNKKYECVYNAFKNDFNNSSSTPRKYYGIKRGTSFEQFLKDLEKISYRQVFQQTYELYDSYRETLSDQEGNKFKQKMDEFIKDEDKDINNFEINKDLCVIPTEGETQYEAFQAIIANSFRGGRNSVYSKLLKIHNIKLIEKDIYKLIYEEL